MATLPAPLVAHPRPVRRSVRKRLKAFLRSLGLRAKRWTRKFMRGTSAGERWLILALGVYVIAMFAFLRLTWQEREYFLLRYLVTFASLWLALLISEVMSKRRLLLRIGLMCIPTIGLAFLQAEGEARLARLSRQVDASALQELRMIDIRAREAHLAEDFPLEPIDSIQSGELADEGFVVKANRVEFVVFEREAQLLVERPELATVIFKLPGDPRARLRAYEQLRAVRPSLATGTSFIFGALREEVGYLDLADLFRRQIKPEYRKLESAISQKVLSTSEACERLSPIIDQLIQVAVVHPVAGLYNHIGTLALNCGRPELALGSFYQALAIDNTEFTPYESLGYALWILNKDSASALQNADRGLALCRHERPAMERSFVSATQTYEFFERSMPEYAPVIKGRIKNLKQRLDATQKDWLDFVDDLAQRLTNDYAYFSALELKNEKEARIYMSDLYEANPDVAEYQDSMGFVLMRFAKNEGELEKARQLFTLAIRNPHAGPETPRLASAHLQELDSYAAALKGYKATTVAAGLRHEAPAGVPLVANR